MRSAFLILLAANIFAAVFSQTTPKTATTKAPPPRPTWPTKYRVVGTIRLPYVPIVEPFEAYIDYVNDRGDGYGGRSRIDYYHGMTKTLQRNDAPHPEAGAYGKMYKIAPETNEKVWNEDSCFLVNGTKAAPIELQEVLPNITSEYKFMGLDSADDTICDSEMVCEKWMNMNTFEPGFPDKKANYTLWTYRMADGSIIPVRFEMMGVNIIFGSHYDHYIIDYKSFTTQEPFHDAWDDLFDPDKLANGKKCEGFPGPGHQGHIYTFNPMAEFVHGESSHVDKAFDDFIAKHDKEYSHELERESKKDAFRQNMRYINSMNRQNLSYKLAPNHFADTTPQERKHMAGKFTSPQQSLRGSHLTSNARVFEYTEQDVKNLPESWDWRDHGAVNPPKDQAICGSCWSFGTVGTLEGSYFVKTGKLMKFSEQALVDCSWGYGNNGCDGGEEWRAFEWMLQHGGIPTDESYGTYMGIDARCHYNSTGVEMMFEVDHYVNVTSQNDTALKVALYNNGPIAVDIDAAHDSLSFYSSGLWHDEKCTPTVLDHAVLAVGWGSENGTDYWIIKNSWSTHWGDQGYVKIAMKPNDCGVNFSPAFAVLKDGTYTTFAPTTASSGSVPSTQSLLAIFLSVIFIRKFKCC